MSGDGVCADGSPGRRERHGVRQRPGLPDQDGVGKTARVGPCRNCGEGRRGDVQRKPPTGGRAVGKGEGSGSPALAGRDSPVSGEPVARNADQGAPATGGCAGKRRRGQRRLKETHDFPGRGTGRGEGESAQVAQGSRIEGDDPPHSSRAGRPLQSGETGRGQDACGRSSSGS